MAVEQLWQNRGCNMQTVYVVTTGSYSDKVIRGICSTEGRATDLAGLLPDANKPMPFVLDGDIPPHPVGHKMWKVEINLKTGNILDTGLTDPTEVYNPEILYPVDRDAYSDMHVWATDVDHANKIATDRRRELLVEGLQ